MILEVKSKLETGRLLEVTDLSRVGFLKRGVIIACLNLIGKTPLLKERLANAAMSSAKTYGQVLIRSGGRRSAEEDLGGIEDKTLKTSVGVTGGREARTEPD